MQIMRSAEQAIRLSIQSYKERIDERALYDTDFTIFPFPPIFHTQRQRRLNTTQLKETPRQRFDWQTILHIRQLEINLRVQERPLITLQLTLQLLLHKRLDLLLRHTIHIPVSYTHLTLPTKRIV